MTECEHEWVDDRPTVSHSLFPHADCNIVQCTKCGAPIQLARRTGLWKGTVTPGVPGFGPPFYYLGG